MDLRGLWEVARYTIGLPFVFAMMTFFVYEAMMLTAALQAERHRRRYPSPGPAGRIVWILASVSTSIVALNAATLVEALVRFSLPLTAAGLWWVGITAERDEDPDKSRQLRATPQASPNGTWAIDPRQLLVALGIMHPGEQTLTAAKRERRIHRMVVAADRLHTATPGSRQAHRATKRLRTLARTATANDITTVRARVTRTTRILELIMPTEPQTATNSGELVFHPGNVHVPQPDSPIPVPAERRSTETPADLPDRTPPFPLEDPEPFHAPAPRTPITTRRPTPTYPSQPLNTPTAAGGPQQNAYTATASAPDSRYPSARSPNASDTAPPPPSAQPGASRTP